MLNNKKTIVYVFSAGGIGGTEQYIFITFLQISNQSKH